MTAKTASQRQMDYVARKREAGYCSGCAKKSEKFRCVDCEKKHADRMRNYWRRTHGKMVEPIKSEGVQFGEAQ